MTWQIEVSYKENVFDAEGAILKKDVADIGISGVQEVKAAYLYNIEGNLEDSEIKKICEELLADPVNQKYLAALSSAATPCQVIDKRDPARHYAVEVWLKKGVTDAVGESTAKAIKDLGIDKKLAIQTGKKFVIRGKIKKQQVKEICERLLVNHIVQDYVFAEI